MLKKSQYRFLLFFVLFTSVQISSFAQKIVIEKSQNLTALSNFRKGDLLFDEDFSGTLDNWMTEGKVVAKIVDGKLYFESKGAETENPKGNIWWEVKVQSPYILEFDYKSVTEYGLSMLFWNAETVDGGDLFKQKRTGNYREYINGNLRAYHFSFHRFGSGKSNIRKAPGFHLVSSAPDPVSAGDTTTHRISIVSVKNRQLIFFDGKLVHNFIDNGAPCLSTESWEHQLPCKGSGKFLSGGAVGIRHTQKQIAIYDNFKIYRLVTE